MALGTVSLRCLLNCSYISQHETNNNNNNVPNKDHKFIVYIGSMPLRAPPGIGQWAITSADNLLHSTNLRHFYTILASSSGSINPYVAFDFQPRNPEDPYTAFIALSGAAIPGMVLERKMSGLPTKRCWKVGPTKRSITMEDAIYFNKQWDTDLQLWKHDCRHHTNEFVEFLTGEKHILEKLSRVATEGSQGIR